MRQRPDPPFYWQFVEPVWKAISIYDGPDAFLIQFRAVRPEVGHLFAAHWCQSEVRNGGFLQFFSNDTGVLAPEAYCAFSTIGLQDWADIIDEAMRVFGDRYPRNRAQRLQMIPQADGRKRAEYDPFHELDNRFYASLKTDRKRFDNAANAYARSVAG